MNKIIGFIILAGASLVAVLLFFLWYFVNYPGTYSMNGMMGSMMNGQYDGGTMQSPPSYIWIFFFAPLIALCVGIAGLVYFTVFPQIRSDNPLATSNQKQSQAEQDGKMEAQKHGWLMLLKTSKPEERKVLEVLSSHDGRYLQKYIVKESGLSKLKTHRIVARFAERGIVMVSKSGNTNEVAIADWLRQDPRFKNTPAQS